MTNLDELLGRLTEEDESRWTTVTLRGLAISRDKDNIHLAVESGVIAVPLSDVADIDHLGTEPPGERVRVTLTTAAGVRQLFNRFGGLGRGFRDPIVIDTHTNTVEHVYTYCGDYGQNDQCDDAEDRISNDEGGGPI